MYVVMPFVEGEILSDRNNRRGTLPLPTRRVSFTTSRRAATSRTSSRSCIAISSPRTS